MSDHDEPENIRLIYEAIGRFTYTWSTIEAHWFNIFLFLYIAETKSTEIKLDKPQAIFNASKNSSVQRRMTCRLAKAVLHPSELVDALEKLNSRTERLSESRNLLAHTHLIITGHGGNFTLAASPLTGSKLANRDIVGFIGECLPEFQKLTADLGAWFLMFRKGLIAGGSLGATLS